MKRVLGAFAVATLLAATAGHAGAQQATGWYGTGSVGYLQVRDVDGNVGGTAVRGEYDAGYTLSLAGGYAFGNGFRAELEGGYGRTSYDSVTIGGTKVGVNGDIDMWSVYAAGYYDFNLGGVKPYVGGGLGFINWDNDHFTATSGGTTVTSTGDHGTNWSAFAEAGLSFAINDRLDLVPAVRYVWIDDEGNGFDNNEAWVFKAGLRYRF